VTHQFSTICAFCDYEHELTSAVTERGVRTEPHPSDGDATLCIKCGEFNIVDQQDARGLRRPTEQERKELASNPMVKAVADAWRAVRHK
jgi:hypothetical protein